MRATVINLQKFSLHDGPGIRTVVFFKGCPLRCAWCANPESQNAVPQQLRDPKKCSHCGRCDREFPDPSLCPTGALSLAGQPYEDTALCDALLQDRDFYLGSGGGVTFSGGEPLLRTAYIAKVAARLRQEHIHLAAETTGYGSPTDFSSLCHSVDLLLFDYKHWNNDMHRRATGVGNGEILENLQAAVAAKKPLWVRIPVIPGFNNSLRDIDAMGHFLARLGVTEAQLLPFHQMGAHKYRLLGTSYSMEGVPSLHKEELTELLACLKTYIPAARIGG